MKLNRLHNTNKGPSLKVLCVCSDGLSTASVVINREYGNKTRSAGLSEDFSLIVVDDVLLAWADVVVCMTGMQEAELKGRITDGTPVQCLHIRDAYAYMDPELQDLILQKYLPL
jgi:predicted protein tyrosine phosphatase